MTLDATAAARVALKGLPGELLIVDNDSQDGSYEKMKAHVAAEGWDMGETPTRVLQSGRNGGYGAGNNVGIATGLSDGTKPDFVYILNSDAFPEPNAIKVLYDYLSKHPNTGFAGSYIKGEDGTKHTSTFRFPSIFSEFETAIRFGPVSKLLKSYRVSMEHLEQTSQVDWLAGASLMMRQSVLDDIGVFDETFFLYFEETDLCRRARMAGHEVVFVRDSIVIHLGSVSTGMKTWSRVPDYWFDSRFYYFRKNHGLFYAVIATLTHLLAGGLHWLRCQVTGKTRGVSPHFLRTLAVHDFVTVKRLILSPKSADRQISKPQIGE
ncbi:MAG: glycosyltransferase family 2 protein [Pseudomonadota bacterium]